MIDTQFFLRNSNNVDLYKSRFKKNLEKVRIVKLFNY